MVRCMSPLTGKLYGFCELCCVMQCSVARQQGGRFLARKTVVLMSQQHAVPTDQTLGAVLQSRLRHEQLSNCLSMLFSTMSTLRTISMDWP